MSLADEIERLQRLHETNVLDDAEFAAAKAKLIGGASAGGGWSFGSSPVTEAERESQTRQWAMILHLSQLAGFVAPVAGLVVPIVIWQVKKGELPGIDEHGKAVANWIISALIYLVISLALMVVLIGIPMLLALMAMCVIFPIIGGIKANNGELWRYPLAIPILW